MDSAEHNKLMTVLDKNIKKTQGRIDEAVKKAERLPQDVNLVAVSKRQPLELIKAAYVLGIRDFGENQIQEGVAKVEACAGHNITWHFIGHLQKNKVRKAVKHFHYLHGIDSMALLERVNTIAAEERVSPKIFLQVNYARDPAKDGMGADEAASVLKAALEMENLTCIGLMGIPPQKAETHEIAAYFRGMRQLRDNLQETYNWPGKLNLGMSGDFEIAIAEGADYIRLGSTLFGPRSQ